MSSSPACYGGTAEEGANCQRVEEVETRPAGDALVWMSARSTINAGLDKPKSNGS